MERRLLLIASVFLTGGLVLAAVVVWLLASSPTARTAQDDTSVVESTSNTTVTGVDTNDADASTAPFYVTTMTHMEGTFADDTDHALFLRHVAQIRWAMDLFDEHGAKLTLESEQSFAIANTSWGLNILKEVVDRGHGVGTHADFGAERVPKSVAFYVRAMKENKRLIDDLIGAENNKGLSGATGAYDWVSAATAAGFSYMDAVTGFGYLSMPLEERPDGWTDDAIRTTYYHDPVPVDLTERTTPFTLANADDFTPDTDGTLVISGGEVGELASMAEGRTSCAPNCHLTMDDVDAYFTLVDTAYANHDAHAVGKVNVHIPLALFTEENETVLRALLSGIATRYIDTGKMTWVTQLAAYEGFVDAQER